MIRMMMTALALLTALGAGTASADQDDLAAALDAMGDRDGVAEYHDGVPENASSWTCETMGNRTCGKRAEALTVKDGASVASPVEAILAAHGVGR